MATVPPQKEKPTPDDTARGRLSRADGGRTCHCRPRSRSANTAGAAGTQETFGHFPTLQKTFGKFPTLQEAEDYLIADEAPIAGNKRTSPHSFSA
jgi:hypothetical protein